MEATHEVDVKKNFCDSLDIIKKINGYLDQLDEELKIMADKPLLERIYKYILKYQKFEGINKFSIPVIGKNNSGKSTILNYLLNLNDTLEVSDGLTTKFISIIRHNENLKGKSPKIYNVNISERANVNNKSMYSFEKTGECLHGDIKDIIKKRNELLEKKKLECLPENYFYIIETYIPLFENEYKLYSDYFEFMDIPGLNERIDEEYKYNIYFRKVIPLFINNVKFSIFIFDTMNYHNITQEPLINFNKELNSFYKNYKNESLKENIENSILILNKIDKSDLDGGIEEEKKNFETHLSNQLKINIKDNHICYLSAKIEIYSKKRYIDFDNYLAYIKQIKDDKNNFMDKLISNMEKDFNAKIERNIDNDDDDDDDDENEQLLQKNEFLKKEGFTHEITNYDYKYYENIFNQNNKHLIKLDNENIIERCLKNSLKKIYEEFVVNNKENKQLYNDILKKFGYNINKIEDDKNISNQISLDKFFENDKYLEELKYIGSKYEQIKQMEPKHEFIKKIYDKFQKQKCYIEDFKYTIATFGQYSTGKSSLLNSLIGYDIIPESSGHCTKIGLVIQYTKNEEDIALYKANFEKQNANNYSFIKNELISKEKNHISDTLKKLNKDYVNGDISYYILSTPILYLDNFIDDDNIKNKIEFIDLPGLQVLENEVEKKMLQKLFEYVNLFLFINDITVVYSEENEIILTNMLDSIMKRNKDLNSILFTLNILETKEENEIIEIFNKYKELINKIIIKYKTSNWDRYIKYYSKLSQKDDILCIYFSPKDHSKNQKLILDIKNEIKTFRDFIKNIAVKGQFELKPDTIKKIKKELKDNYINKIDTKNEYMDKNIHLNKDDEEIKQYICCLKEDFNLKNENFEEFKQDIYCIIKRYTFLKTKIDNNCYKYIDFCQLLKNKIKDVNFFPKSLVLNSLLELNNYICYISSNISRYKKKEENNKILFDFSKIETIYGCCKTNINNVFNEKIIKLKEIFYEFAKKDKNLSKKFELEIDDLYQFIEESLKIYIKKIKIENDSIMKRLNIKINEINLIYDKIDGKALSIGLGSFYGGAVIFGGIISGSILFEGGSILAAGVIFSCSIVPLAVVLIFVFGIVKFHDYLCFNKKIENEFNKIKEKLEEYKNKAFDLMEKIAKNISENLEEIKISQKAPMNNIIGNEHEFSMFKDDFYNYIKKYI